jgi:hypothetical protein
MVAVTTSAALELALTFAIGWLKMSTGETALAGVGGIDHFHRHARPPRFVTNEHAQLSERPIAVFRSCVRAANPCPRPNALQVLKGKHTLRVFSVLHELFTDAVIDIRLKPRLPACQLAQMAFGGARSGTLQAPPQPLMTPTVALDDFAGRNLTVADRDNVGDTHVHAERAFGFFLRRLELHFRCQFHSAEYSTGADMFQIFDIRHTPFLPAPKGGGFSAFFR